MMPAKSLAKSSPTKLTLVTIADLWMILSESCNLGGDENSKVGVAGDSGGALIAGAICHTIENLDFQVETICFL
jgi:hypothetical protein